MDLDNLFAFWPAIVILWGLASKLIDKINESVNQQNNAGDFASETTESQAEPENFELDIPQKTISQTSNKSEEDNKVVKSKKPAKKLKTEQKKKKATSAKRQTSSFGKKEVMQGIIFKEILDQPRAKKPHPIYRKDD
ncbi:hypothetical protein Halha_0943 [Halobacteroides halobius DSM 5150]|uniref:Uncharacterized protein n=1 Tax=Halobacteroides halobius (strain ATCC 35273 / DSM 5150 / MD-1) TaxID=748449 RepID=L0K977_HALHC|nr:hypothetical protein [Halobacteroides halobius]AGB40904.1 hypothetical protein Halha_0943 [Halobacteroides halobius DSM 5150]